MSKLKCKITLETWYQETPKECQFEILPDDFESIDDALSFLAVNHEAILNNYPVVGISINYVSL